MRTLSKSLTKEPSSRSCLKNLAKEPYSRIMEPNNGALSAARALGGSRRPCMTISAGRPRRGKSPAGVGLPFGRYFISILSCLVQGRAGKDFDLTWHVQGRAGEDFDLTWHVQGRAGKDFDLTVHGTPNPKLF